MRPRQWQQGGSKLSDTFHIMRNYIQKEFSAGKRNKCHSREAGRRQVEGPHVPHCHPKMCQGNASYDPHNSENPTSASIGTETSRQRKYLPMLCTVKPQTLLLQAAAKSMGMPGFKRDQANRLSCQNQPNCVIKMAPKTNLVALGNGEAKPRRDSLLSCRGRHLGQGVLSPPGRSSRLCEGCPGQGEQGNSNSGMGSLRRGQEGTASPHKTFRAHPSFCHPLTELSHCPLLALHTKPSAAPHGKCGTQGPLWPLG